MKRLSYIFAVIGVAAIGYWAFVFFGARIYQSRQIAEFKRSAPAVNAPAAEAPAGSKPVERQEREKPERPREGDRLAILDIPRLKLSSLVIEGADKESLAVAPGHIPGTALPGENGNVGIAAHRDTFFRPLRFIRKGDVITLTTHEKEFEYKVAFTKIVKPHDVQVLDPTDSAALTLVTCYPFYYVGAAPERFIVRAECQNCSAQ